MRIVGVAPAAHPPLPPSLPVTETMHWDARFYGRLLAGVIMACIRPQSNLTSDALNTILSHSPLLLPLPPIL